MLIAFLKKYTTGKESLVSFEEVYTVSLATLAAEQSLLEGMPVNLFLGKVTG
jgi:hypothetical protein